MQNQEFLKKEQVAELLKWVLAKVGVTMPNLPNELIDNWVSQNGIKTFNPFERFARKCSATFVGMNIGYVWFEGDEYFSTEEVLLARIKKYVEDYNLFDEVDTFDDKELLDWAYNGDLYYHTEWDEEHMEDGFYLADGTFIETNN